MLFFIVVVIALGWAGWLWSWGRDRYVSTPGLGLPPNPFGPTPTSRFGAPQSRSHARRRRREVLGSLVVGVLISFLLSQAWALLWAVTVVGAFLLGWYAVAVYQLENGGDRSIGASFQDRFGPVLDDADPGADRVVPHDVLEPSA